MTRLSLSLSVSDSWGIGDLNLNLTNPPYLHELCIDSEGLGEIFEGDSADMCAAKFPLMLKGAERRV